MIKASIDLGTNTCLFLIAELNPARGLIQKVLQDESRIVRLGQGVHQNRSFHPEAMERTIISLREYAQQLKNYAISPEQVVCVATSQARDSTNSAEFFKRIESELGLRFRVLSGVDEARYTFLGANPFHPKELAPQWVLDIGGGSTEVISADTAMSLDIGSVRLTEKFLHSDPVTDEEFWRCQDWIDEVLIREFKNEISTITAVAGTATSLGAWYLGLERFDPEKVESVVLTTGDVHRMVEELKWRSSEERRKLPCMESKRADVILAGALILWRILELGKTKECRISARGLRYGVLRGLS